MNAAVVGAVGLGLVCGWLVPRWRGSVPSAVSLAAALAALAGVIAGIHGPPAAASFLAASFIGGVAHAAVRRSIRNRARTAHGGV